MTTMLSDHLLSARLLAEADLNRQERRVARFWTVARYGSWLVLLVAFAAWLALVILNLLWFFCYRP